MKKTISSIVALLTAMFFMAAVQLRADDQNGPKKDDQKVQAPEKEKPGTKTPVINKMQKNQMKRIKKGEKSGELTKEEAKTLVKDEKKIQEQKKEMKSDGKMTKDERKTIRKELKTESKKIYHKKHNDEKRRDRK